MILSGSTYVGQNDLPSDKHQIVDADSGPISAASVAAHTQLGAYFPGLVKEQPYLLTLFDPASTARRVRSVVKDEWYYNLRRLDRRAHNDKVLSRKLGLLSFALQCCLGHDPRLEADVCVCAQLLLGYPAFGFRVHGGGVGGCALARGGCFGYTRISLLIVVETERQFALAGYLALLLEEWLGRRYTVLGKLACSS
jgi:hypothetical protein